MIDDFALLLTQRTNLSPKSAVPESGGKVFTLQKGDAFQARPAEAFDVFGSETAAFTAAKPLAKPRALSTNFRESETDRFAQVSKPNAVEYQVDVAADPIRETSSADNVLAVAVSKQDSEGTLQSPKWPSRGKGGDVLETGETSDENASNLTVPPLSSDSNVDVEPVLRGDGQGAVLEAARSSAERRLSSAIDTPSMTKGEIFRSTDVFSLAHKASSPPVSSTPVYLRSDLVQTGSSGEMVISLPSPLSSPRDLGGLVLEGAAKLHQIARSAIMSPSTIKPQQLTIQLQPEGLGKITITLRGSHSPTEVIVRADNEAVARMLEQDANLLRAGLKTIAPEMGNAELSVSKNSSDQNEWSSANDHHTASGRRGTSPDENRRGQGGDVLHEVSPENTNDGAAVTTLENVI